MTASFDFADEIHAAKSARKHHRVLMRHHDCRDPDHPGCVHCEPELFGILGKCHICGNTVHDDDEHDITREGILCADCMGDFDD